MYVIQDKKNFLESTAKTLKPCELYKLLAFFFKVFSITQISKQRYIVWTIPFYKKGAVDIHKNLKGAGESYKWCTMGVSQEGDKCLSKPVAKLIEPC